MKRVTWVKYLLLFIIIVASVYAWFMLSANSETTSPNLMSEVVVADIEKSIVATGQLEPKRYVEVGAQVSGQVKVIHVEEGHNVEKNQLLVEIDATVFETQVQKTEAALESKKAQLAQLRAELELAIVRAKRNQMLFEQDAVSEDVVVSSNTNVKVLNSKITASIAEIRADEASLEGDKTTLGFAKIYAPISGTIATISVREGQTLNANQNAPVLLQISDLTTMTLRAEVSEADVQRIHKDMPVYFTTLGDSQTRYHSKVRQVLPTPTEINDVVLYQVLVDIENPKNILMDAMTTQVFFVQEKQSQTLTVPLAAIKGRGKRKFVLLEENNELVRRPVKVGIQNRTTAQIIEGLSEGEKVVVGLKAESVANMKERRNGAQGTERRGPRSGF